MLPSDFSGPPAAAVKGNVLTGKVGSAEARRPRMSLEWLDEVRVSLVGQSLNYQRSDKLQTDWDIGLSLPKETSKFEAYVGARSVRIGVAKIVYYDDRDQDEKLDWSCDRAVCDRVVAVSSQFVLFVERPPYCQSFQGAPAKPRLTAGFHYYSFDGVVARELPGTDPLSFTVIDQLPVDSDPTVDLQDFAESLVGAWKLTLTSGC